jgi:glycosyltransferase involved in cell wall biosynthesis
MRILLWHGYLMRGSGSNIYTANVARTWRRSGHDVLLMCQEMHPQALDFVDEAGSFQEDNTAFTLHPVRGAQPASGRCRLVRPAIGKILPVYVYDEYEGFTAKRFVDLTDEELERYTHSNVTAMVTAIEEHRPDAIVTGHEVMGPYIAREACARTGTRYAAKLHGSALEYAVKEQPARYLSYAREGLGGAVAVTAGSGYMLRAASEVIPEVLKHGAVVNPGCDIDLFRPTADPAPIPPIVGYVGKFIVQKGVHNFIAALGLTRSSFESKIVGYGGFERELHDLYGSLRTGDVERALALAQRAGLSHLADFLVRPPDAVYLQRLNQMALTWPGRLDHEPLSRELPRWTICVVPSVLAEAFGMVAAEAAACGVLPVVPAHSGIGEVGAAVEDALGAPGLLTFDPEDPVRGIATAIDRILTLPADVLRSYSHKATELARERWSWEHVADGLLRHAISGVER